MDNEQRTTNKKDNVWFIVYRLSFIVMTKQASLPAPACGRQGGQVYPNL